ncbi:hypothetical protein GSI_12536 [Ganoderma sinense ZZ0214-1]|uniref:Uncharacterized protein n=1 Tax=Ganoderma sinense ZZ0214-1 TaxID=1077348 RepID=A0A2G8RT13_9APHY|nr:hypothetical protein GSI_12536 [Ganoderma sinense ZZ0214-1]
MPPVLSTLAGHMGVPFIIPNTTHPTVPSIDANENMAGRSITLPGVLHHNHAPFLLLPHDEEQTERTFSDGDNAAADSVHGGRACGTVDHPHVLHGDLRLPVQGTVAHGLLGLFRIPDGPGNASAPPTGVRPSAGVARRNRLFAFGDSIPASGRRTDDLAIGDAIPQKAETQGLPPMELGVDGSVRKADPTRGGTLGACAENDLAALKSTEIISIHRDEPSLKAKDCITTR